MKKNHISLFPKNIQMIVNCRLYTCTLLNILFFVNFKGWTRSYTNRLQVHTQAQLHVDAIKHTGEAVLQHGKNALQALKAVVTGILRK
jgi:hypothetical protein